MGRNFSNSIWKCSLFLCIRRYFWCVFVTRHSQRYSGFSSFLQGQFFLCKRKLVLAIHLYHIFFWLNSTFLKGSSIYVVKKAVAFMFIFCLGLVYLRLYLGLYITSRLHYTMGVKLILKENSSIDKLCKGPFQIHINTKADFLPKNS